MHSSLTARGHLEYCYAASAQRLQYVLRLAFLAALVITATGEPTSSLLPRYGVLLIYAIAIVAASAIWHRSGPRVRSTMAWCLGITDVVVIIALQKLCNGSLLLVVALFLFPILTAFQARPALTSATIGLGSFMYGGAAVLDPDLFLTVDTARAVAIAVLFCLVSVCCIMHSVAHSRHIACIAQLLADRSFLLAEVISAEERERAKLAEFIHDGPLQSVLAARFALEQATPDTCDETMHRTSVELLAVARQLRRTTGQLYPEVLKEVGLVEAIRSLLRTMHERTQIDYQFNVEYTRRRPLEPLVFAAARELIENIARHSSATRAWVSLTERTDSLELTVTDNGIGTDAKQLHQRLAEGHIGLASLRVRVEAAGGILEYLQAPVSPGTRVRVTLPLSFATAQALERPSCSRRLRALLKRRDAPENTAKSLHRHL
ncbi:ATP-binding protein [Streptomyces sp. NPDC008121]|uniref:sensor histidine kinase n=1 Tax=Streptomyces sp. NPDC008121 TaxID=3364809 RepID=UPI0036EA48AE